MKTIRTPNNIEVLLHYYRCPCPHPRVNAPAVQQVIQEFLEMGVLQFVNVDVYRTTELGDAWVQALCNTPPPRTVFVDAAGNVLSQ